MTRKSCKRWRTNGSLQLFSRIQQSASDKVSKMRVLLRQPKVGLTAKYCLPSHCTPNRCHWDVSGCLDELNGVVDRGVEQGKFGERNQAVNARDVSDVMGS